MTRIKLDYPLLIKEVRRQLSMSHDDFALELGVSPAVLIDWENNQADPSKLAKAHLDAFCREMQMAGVLDL